MQTGKAAVVAGSTSVIGPGIASVPARSGANIGRTGFGAADEVDRIVSDLKRQH